MMKITVLMTVYNGGAYLRQAVESVLAQSLCDFEFLIVNDASTDDSLKVLFSYLDSRIRIIDNPKNYGQTRSLNIGLQEAGGDWVARIDADDIALPGWLEGQSAYLERHPECDVVSAWALKIDARGRFQGTLNVPLTREALVRRSLTASPINHGGCLMRRAAILAVGGYREDYRVVADYDLWSRLLRAGRLFAVRKEAGMTVRFHGGSISSSKKYDVVMPETISVMKDNIEAFSSYRPSADEMRDLWRASYDQPAINIDGYIRGRSVAEKVLGGLHPPWQGREDRELLKVMDGKMGFVLMKAGRGADLRKLCRAMVSPKGWRVISVALFCFSWLGGAMRLVPFLYEILRKIKD